MEKANLLDGRERMVWLRKMHSEPVSGLFEDLEFELVILLFVILDSVDFVDSCAWSGSGRSVCCNLRSGWKVARTVGRTDPKSPMNRDD